MKNNFLNSISVIFLIAFLSGCSVHQGYIVNSTSLSSNNFKYVHKDLKGTVAVTYFLGLGGGAGPDKQAIMELAKKDLLAETPLEDNQALANLTVSWKKTFVLPLIVTSRCTITADVVEFH